MWHIISAVSFCSFCTNKCSANMDLPFWIEEARRWNKARSENGRSLWRPTTRNRLERVTGYLSMLISPVQRLDNRWTNHVVPSGELKLRHSLKSKIYSFPGKSNSGRPKKANLPYRCYRARAASNFGSRQVSDIRVLKVSVDLSSSATVSSIVMTCKYYKKYNLFNIQTADLSSMSSPGDHPDI